MNAYETGVWGMPPDKKDIKIYLANNKFMISEKWCILQNGILIEGLIFRYLSGNKIEETEPIETSYSNSGSMMAIVESWDSEIIFIKQKKNFPEILLKIKGEKANVEFTETKRYRFDGKGYVEK